MLGFTLSKLNLLILVTALFAIVAFFMFSLTDIMVSRSAQQMLGNHVETIAGIMDNYSVYFEQTVAIADSISYFSGIQQGKRFFYVMEISRYPEDYDPEHLSKLIFKIAGRKEQKKFIATSSIDLNAQIFLYQWPVEGILTDVKSQSSVKLDPMNETAISDSMVLAKEVYKGENYLHVIVCSSAQGQCELNLRYAGCCVKKWRGGTESKYLPAAEEEKCRNLTC